MAKSVVLEVKNVKKTFHLGKEDLEVLKGINLEIYSGEYVIFFGPSGCGKSTLLNVLSGLEPPTEGQLLVRGESLYKKSQKEITDYRRSKIGIVFQQFNLLRALTIQENIALPLAAGGEGYKKRMDRAAHLLDTVGLKKYMKHKPTELSGGQQQRVAIGRALSTNPWILICDEPTGNLDSKSADEIMNIIEGLNSKSKRTVLLVTHNPDYLHFPHRVFYLKDGEIIKTQVNRDITKEDSGHHDLSSGNIDYKSAFENISRPKGTEDSAKNETEQNIKHDDETKVSERDKLENVDKFPSYASVKKNEKNDDSDSLKDNEQPSQQKSSSKELFSPEPVEKPTERGVFELLDYYNKKQPAVEIESEEKE
ncbi:MAG: ATP-binding cassette domain-containing protein [Patescibacteria group bacterium]